MFKRKTVFISLGDNRFATIDSKTGEIVETYIEVNRIFYIVDKESGELKMVGETPTDQVSPRFNGLPYVDIYSFGGKPKVYFYSLLLFSWFLSFILYLFINLQIITDITVYLTTCFFAMIAFEVWIHRLRMMFKDFKGFCFKTYILNIFSSITQKIFPF